MLSFKSTFPLSSVCEFQSPSSPYSSLLSHVPTCPFSTSVSLFLPSNKFICTLFLDGILKSRDITLPTKVRLVKALVPAVVMYGCESWTIKKPECQRIDAFKLWCWRRLLRVPWTARRSNQSILKEINLEYSLEGVMLKLKL